MPDFSNDPVSDYLKRAARADLLSAEQEVKLATEIEAGLFAGHLLSDGNPRARRLTRELRDVERAGINAMEALISANLRLVVSIARHYTGQGLDFLDVIQEGNIGLHRAACKFDFTLGYKFSTYATWWIRQAITRAVADQARLIRLPVHIVEQVNKLKATIRQRGLVGLPVTTDYLAKATDNSTDKVEHLISVSRAVHSLDFPVPDGRGGLESLGDQLVDPYSPDVIEVIAKEQLTAAVHGILDTFSEREASIIALRFGLTDGEEKTLDAIGQVFGVSRERIRQIEKQMLALLREPERSQSLRAHYYGEAMAAARGPNPNTTLETTKDAS